MNPPVPNSTHCPFEIWDVFSRERFRGNPLAVFPHASALPETQLAAIAREMNHSETAFVFPRSPLIEAREGVIVRIFSRSGSEMKFAGHPVLGTAFALWSHNRQRTGPDGSALKLSLPVGTIPVVFRRVDGGNVEGEMTQPEPSFGETHAPNVLLPLLGLRAEDWDPSRPLQTVSTGRPNVLVFLKTRNAVARAVVDWPALDRYFANGDRERGVYLITRDVEEQSTQYHARKPTRLGDDPVTGSAAGCAIAYLVQHGVVTSGKRVLIEQGSEVNRRGELSVGASSSGDRITAVRVGGQAIRSAQGFIEFASE